MFTELVRPTPLITSHSVVYTAADGSCATCVVTLQTEQIRSHESVRSHLSTTFHRHKQNDSPTGPVRPTPSTVSHSAVLTASDGVEERLLGAAMKKVLLSLLRLTEFLFYVLQCISSTILLLKRHTSMEFPPTFLASHRQILFCGSEVRSSLDLPPPVFTAQNPTQLHKDATYKFTLTVFLARFWY